MTLPPESHAPARARAFAVARLHECGLQRLGEVCELLVSELVTNVVRHARTEVELCLSLSPTGVHVDVRDGCGARLPEAAPASGGEMESGRGLLLVASLATRWGYAPDHHGKDVWFELDAEG